MLTYALDKTAGVSLYEQLYRRVKEDILSGRLAAGEKLPSKRALAAHLEVSVITVKNAYEQLMAEGYLTGVEKKGYFVSSVLPPLPSQPPPVTQDAPEPGERTWFLDLVTNSIDAEDFPFTVWARLMRQTILEQGTGLLHPTPPQGAWALRRAIADHLRQFRGMAVGAEQIIVGAGTEVLYSLLVQLLGREMTYGVEDPGYGKIARIYRACGASVAAVPLDGDGLSVQELRRSGADVVHISPSHHYPTGRVMPITRRQELLRWAQEKPERIILEDDYDSEFRFVGRPIPTLFSVDDSGQVVYLNTFSKTIAPSIRISFMVLHRLRLRAVHPRPVPVRRLVRKAPEPHAQALPPEAGRRHRRPAAKPPVAPRRHRRGGRRPALPAAAGRRAAGRRAAPRGGGARHPSGYAVRLLPVPARSAPARSGGELHRHRHRKAPHGAGASGGAVAIIKGGPHHV